MFFRNISRGANGMKWVNFAVFFDPRRSVFY